jgi:hypothetical protein
LARNMGWHMQRNFTEPRTDKIPLANPTKYVPYYIL